NSNRRHETSGLGWGGAPASNRTRPRSRSIARGTFARSQPARRFLSANEHTMADAAMDVRLRIKTIAATDVFPPGQAVAVPGCAGSAAALTLRAVCSWERIVASNT